MRNPFFVATVTAAAVFSPFVAPAQAQDDRLAYVLTAADLLPKAKVPTIEVAFGESVPFDLFSRADSELLTDAALLRHWLVRSMPYATEGAPNPVPAELRVEALTVQHDAKVVRLELTATAGNALDPATHLIKIAYLRANHPDVVIGQPKRAGARARWVSTDSADTADVYFSGKVTGAENSETSYGAELKLRHAWSLRRLGELGGRFEFAGEALQNGDPDTILFGTDYQFIEPFTSGTGLIIRAVPIGAEFDRENETRNLLTSVEGKLVPPGVHPWKRSPANLSLLTGLEAGTNYVNPVQPAGGGGFLRWKIGVAAAFHTPIGEDFGFTVSALWQRRFLTSDEVFVDTMAGQEVPVVNDKSRNHLALDLTFDITKALGFAVQYRDGSLPPRFEDVKSSIATSLVIKLQRVEN